ncbi:MAG TPA: lipid A export permease/ATP-binding protein MsbA [Steroidobacteraceae bacterium]|nr:lipid A export permease/ATP-binding protein MsbA [Steroidobacteraceae bacterium]
MATLPLNQDAKRIYLRLMGYARPYWPVFLLGVFGNALFATTDAGFVWFVRNFLKDAFARPDPKVLVWVPIGAVVLFFMRGVGDFLSTYCAASVGRRVIKTLRGQLFGHYLKLPTTFYDREAAANLLSKLTYNVELLAEASANSITVMIRDSLTVIALIGYLFFLNWRLAAISIILAPLIAWLIRKVNQLFRRYSQRIQNSMGDVTRIAKEGIEGHRLIKLFNAQAHEAQVFDRVNELNRRNNMKLILTRALSNPVVQLVASIGLAFVLYVMIGMVLRHRLPLEDFFAFLTALLLTTAPLRRVVNVAAPLQQGIAAGGSIFEILDCQTEELDAGRPLDHSRGDVEFRDVGYRYTAENGEVLSGISFHVRPGETIAIVGKSGSGKSTLVSLLARYYDVTEGQILLDGVDVRDYRLRDLRRQVSMVSQDVLLFNDTIRGNIAFSVPAAPPAAIEAAAAAAHVTEFTDDAPGGLEFLVGDRGSLVSGGQRQRISIARAVLKDAPILILDEATSALDTELERKIQQSLDELMRGRTTFVIAHRLTTIENADRILVLDAGQLIESGTHAELIAHNGHYAALHRLQFNV